MSENYYNTPELMQAQKEAETAGTTASNYASAASLLPQKLREAVMAKVDYNKDIIEQKNKAQADYFAAPSQAREKYQDIWNPFTREKLVTEARTQAYTPYANLTDILGQRLGSISDIINAGTGAFNADVTAKQNVAASARQKFTDLFSLIQANLAQKNTEANYALDKYKATHPAGSSKSALETAIEKKILAFLENGGTGTGGSNVPKPTEPEPMYSPSSGEGTRSAEGQWIYIQGGWMPIVKSSTGSGSVDSSDPLGLGINI